MGQEIIVVDAFAKEPFTGNPAAVCVLPEPADEAWMQSVASEMHLSETAFLVAREDGFDLRWFTPTAEVDLCGHATLASAHVLWETRRIAADREARFHTRSGVLKAKRLGARIEIDLPAEPPEPVSPPPELPGILGDVTPRTVGKNRMDYLVELESEDAVRSLAPDLRLLATLPVDGLIATTLATTEGLDFISRYFAPRFGIDEDPVTGAAHCCLGPFWSQRLGRSELSAYQASSRGGFVHVRAEGDRVHLAGSAVTVMRGELVGGAVDHFLYGYG